MKSIISITNYNLLQENDRYRVELTIGNVEKSIKYNNQYHRGYIVNSEDGLIGLIVDCAGMEECKKKFQFGRKCSIERTVFVCADKNNKNTTRYIFAYENLGTYGIEECARKALERLLNVYIRHDDKPDLTCKIGNKSIGIEVIEACDADIKTIENSTNKYTKMKYIDKFNANNTDSVSLFSLDANCDNLGVVSNNKQRSIKKIQECINKKDGKEYKGFDEVWLAIYCNYLTVSYIGHLENELQNIHSKKYNKIFIIEDVVSKKGQVVIEVDMVGNGNNIVIHHNIV